MQTDGNKKEKNRPRRNTRPARKEIDNNTKTIIPNSGSPKFTLFLASHKLILLEILLPKLIFIELLKLPLIPLLKSERFVLLLKPLRLSPIE